MEKFELKQSLKEPRVFIDFRKGKIKITGRSTLSDPKPIYTRLLEVFKDYCNAPHDTTHVFIDLEQYNVASSFYIQEIIAELIAIKKTGKGEVKIYWYYDPDDYGIIGDINFLSQHHNFNIKAIAYEAI